MRLATIALVAFATIGPQAWAQSEEPLCGWGPHGAVGLSQVRAEGLGAILGQDGGATSVRSNALVRVAGKGVIYGNATSAGTVEVLGNGQITGGILQGAPLIALESAAAAVAAAAAENDNAMVPLTAKGKNPVKPGPALVVAANDSLTLPAGVYYFISLSLAGKSTLIASGPVRIYLSGRATLAGNAACTSGSAKDLLVISSSTAPITLAGGMARLGVYAPEASVSVTGWATLRGAVASRSVVVNGKGKLIHDPAMAEVCAIDTPCEPQVSTFTEDFTTTSARDAAETTALWETTGGHLTLPFASSDPAAFEPAQPWIEHTLAVPAYGYASRTIVHGDLLIMLLHCYAIAIFSLADPAQPALLSLIPRSVTGYGWVTWGRHTCRRASANRRRSPATRRRSRRRR